MTNPINNIQDADFTMATSSSSLPDDIIFQLMLSMGSPNDLYSFVRTSRAYYHIFACYKASILKVTLDNTIGPNNMPGFLLAYEAYHVCSLEARRSYNDGVKNIPSNSERRRRYRNLRIKRIRDHFDHTAPTSLPKGLPVDELEYFCRIWRFFDNFVHDYAKRALSQLGDGCFHDESGITQAKIDDVRSLPLTTTEYGRFFRAFCHFEEWRRLFGGPDHLAGWMCFPTLDETQLQWAAGFWRWEQIEFLSVSVYVFEKLNEILQDSCSRSSIYKEDIPELDVESSNYQSAVEKSFIYMNSVRRDKIEFISEIGLPFLEAIQQMPTERRKEAIGRFDDFRCDPCLMKAAATKRFQRMSLKREETPWVSSSLPTPLEMENPGYKVFPKEIRHFRKDKKFERCGIIFWDQERLNMLKPRLACSDFKADESADVMVHDPTLRFRIENTISARERAESSSEAMDELNQFLDDLEY